MTALYILVYVSLAVFLAACVARAVRYARLPLNLRWEIYPVPRNLRGELKTMAAEIFFLRALFDHNRRLWLFSYPFHLGLYTLILTALAAGVSIALPWIGFSGCLLAIFGACGLLVSRLRDPKLRAYSAPADFFNLVLFLAAAGLLALSKFTTGPGLVETFRALRTFDTTHALPASQAAATGLTALLIAYIPLTHMSHFIGKYFTYHSIRWSDQPAPSIRAEYLTYKPTWSASHIGADGATPWSEIVARNPAERSK